MTFNIKTKFKNMIKECNENKRESVIKTVTGCILLCIILFLSIELIGVWQDLNNTKDFNVMREFKSREISVYESYEYKYECNVYDNLKSESEITFYNEKTIQANEISSVEFVEYFDGVIISKCNGKWLTPSYYNYALLKINTKNSSQPYYSELWCTELSENSGNYKWTLAFFAKNGIAVETQ